MYVIEWHSTTKPLDISIQYAITRAYPELVWNGATHKSPHPSPLPEGEGTVF